MIDLEHLERVHELRDKVNEIGKVVAQTRVLIGTRIWHLLVAWLSIELWPIWVRVPRLFPARVGVPPNTKCRSRCGCERGRRDLEEGGPLRPGLPRLRDVCSEGQICLCESFKLAGYWSVLSLRSRLTIETTPKGRKRRRRGRNWSGDEHQGHEHGGKDYSGRAHGWL